jgi:hypothetical protein
MGAVNIFGGRRLTTHSTGARVSLAFIENLTVSALNARPVNSSVRFLSNSKVQNSASTFTNPESQRYACVLIHVECSEPAPASSVDDKLR